MKITISETVKNIVINSMIEKNIDTVTKQGITFSTEKKDGSITTGKSMKDGRVIYIQSN